MQQNHKCFLRCTCIDDGIFWSRIKKQWPIFIYLLIYLDISAKSAWTVQKVLVYKNMLKVFGSLLNVKLLKAWRRRGTAEGSTVRVSVPLTLCGSRCHLSPGEVLRGLTGHCCNDEPYCATFDRKACSSWCLDLQYVLFPLPWFSIVIKTVLERQIKRVFN